MQDMRIALLIATGVAISLYCLGLIAAAWWAPSLRRLMPFRPRWQDGVRTGPWGMTAQALSLQCLVLMVATKSIGWDHAFKWTFTGFLISGVATFAIWACDAAIDQERNRD